MITVAMTLSESDAYLAVKGDEQYADAARTKNIPAWVAIDERGNEFSSDIRRDEPEWYPIFYKIVEGNRP